MDPSVQTKLQEHAAAGDYRVLSQFFQLLATNPQRVTYGANHVMGALLQGAVKELILTQVLFRHPKPEVRAKYLEMRSLARSKGGSTIIMSDMHPSGARLPLMPFF